MVAKQNGDDWILSADIEFNFDKLSTELAAFMAWFATSIASGTGLAPIT